MALIIGQMCAELTSVLRLQCVRTFFAGWGIMPDHLSALPQINNPECG